jgi:biopolymer transport protein ExbB
LFQIMLAGHWPVWILLVVSVVALALIIERSIALRRIKILPPNLLNELMVLVNNKQINANVADKLEQNSPFGRVLAAGVRNVDSSRELMKEAIEDAGAAVSHDLEKYMTTLGSIATAAPLLGLFGTVIGMIEIFAAQGPTGGANPAQLASGISIALYATGFGLAIGIPALIAHRHFRRLIDTFVNDMQVQAVRFVDMVHQGRA